MFDLNRSIQTASAQSLVAALMLLSPERSIMARVLSDLAAHPQRWQAFVLVPMLPPTEDGAYLGILACLRDLAFRWTADTLYILTPDLTAAEGVRSRSVGWNCSEVTVRSLNAPTILCLSEAF